MKEAPPPIAERFRIPARIGAVLAAYGIYRLLAEDAIVGAALVGIGSMLVAFTLIDRWTLRRRETSGLLQVGTAILGLALIAIGAVVVLR